MRRYRPYTGYRRNSKRGKEAIKIIVTAGPTIEPIDPVRFISNRSTGYMGYKLAELASKKKHVVTLISGPASIKIPHVKRFISITTADDLLRVLQEQIKAADCLIMCAAVSDFRTSQILKKKIKRTKILSLDLVGNKDILTELSRHKKRRLFIGFSLETENLIKNSYKKLKAKRLDLIVANLLRKHCNIFGDNKLDVCIIERSGSITRIRQKNKAFIAHVLLDKIERMWYLKENRL